MKRRRLRFEGYKNVRAGDIEFTPAPWIYAIIGRNGGGKPDLIEAILQILIGCRNGKRQ